MPTGVIAAESVSVGVLVRSTSLPEVKPVTGSLNVTVKSIGPVPVVAACPLAGTMVTVGAELRR